MVIMEESEYMIKLVFDMCVNQVEKEKIREFWEIIRKQTELQPYIFQFEKKSENLQVPIQVEDKKDSEVGNLLMIPNELKQMDFNKIIYSIPCKIDNRIFRSKYFKYANEIEESYNDLNNELKAYEERKRIEKSMRIVIEEIISKMEN